MAAGGGFFGYRHGKIVGLSRAGPEHGGAYGTNPSRAQKHARLHKQRDIIQAQTHEHMARFRRAQQEVDDLRKSRDQEELRELPWHEEHARDCDPDVELSICELREVDAQLSERCGN